MSGKKYFPIQLSFQSANPATGFLPQAKPYGSIPSGVYAGVMTGTNTIYSQIIDKQEYDNIGLELSWTGTPTGTIQIMASNSGINFYGLSFSPLISQPAGSAGGYLISLNQHPWRYFMVQYTNTSGSGSFYTYGFFGDIN
jgi:hypothetical protein